MSCGPGCLAWQALPGLRHRLQGKPWALGSAACGFAPRSQAQGLCVRCPPPPLIYTLARCCVGCCSAASGPQLPGAVHARDRVLGAAHAGGAAQQPLCSAAGGWVGARCARPLPLPPACLPACLPACTGWRAWPPALRAVAAARHPAGVDRVHTVGRLGGWGRFVGTY